MMVLLRTLLTSPLSSLIGRICLGGLFLFAGFIKASDPVGFAQAIDNYQLLPFWAAKVVAVVLPWIEIIIGGSLLLGIWTKGGSLLSSLLLLVFTIALLINLVRGLDVDCGCFSTSASGGGGGNMTWYLFRDIVLLAMSIQVFIFDEGPAAWQRLRLKRR